MARTPKSKGDKLVVYPKQWPDTRVDKQEVDKDEPVTPHLGHEYRLTKKFSEQTAPPKPGAKYTLGTRMARVGGVRRGVPIATTRVEEKDMHRDIEESSMTVWNHPKKDVSVEWNKHGHKFTVIKNGERVSGHATQKSAVAAANRRVKQMDEGKTLGQFVAEAAKRGRPRKLRPGEEADTLHIQDQLNKLTHPNHVEVHFKDGSKHRIPREHANMAIHHLNSLKPIERSEHAEHMAKSHSDFYHVLSKKSVPSKHKGISLAGPKLRKEEVELEESHRVGVTYSDPDSSAVSQRSEKKFKNVRVKAESEDEAITKAKKHFKKSGYRVHDAIITTMKEEVEHDDDGWYAHKEMHGSKAISKEDWKKGVRPKKSMKKEEAEQFGEEWGSPKIAKGIRGTSASTAKMSSISTRPLRGKQKKPKVQQLDVKKLSEEQLEIYEALSDKGKELFEKMSSDQLAKMVAVYRAKGGKINKVKAAKRKESDKSWPASKMGGSTFNRGVKKLSLRDLGLKGKGK